MRVLVCGGRHYADREHVFSVLDRWNRDCLITDLAHGAASGADRLAGEWAVTRGKREHRFPANWRPDGDLDRRAGFKRNQNMLNAFKPDLGIAFPGGNGTFDMICRMEKAGVVVIRPNPDEWKLSMFSDVLGWMTDEELPF